MEFINNTVVWIKDLVLPYKRKLMFKTKPVVGTKSHASYSGKYVLTVEYLDMGKGYWNYSRGTVKTKDGKKIAVVNRNYGTFPFAFVEHHKDGHDYLICGEDYQGQTVIQLDTGRRVDYLPESAHAGFGFCWAAIHPSPDGQTLAVEGCYWACPYEVVFFDFSKPMVFPLPELDRNSDYDEFVEWISPQEAKISRAYEVHAKLGKRDYELTDQETSAEDYEDNWKEANDVIIWKR